MKLIMIDGKLCQALTKMASSALCYICGETPSEMNNLKKLVQKAEAEENFEFGLLTLRVDPLCGVHPSHSLSIAIQKMVSKDE